MVMKQLEKEINIRIFSPYSWESRCPGWYPRLDKDYSNSPLNLIPYTGRGYWTPGKGLLIVGNSELMGLLG